MSANLDRCAAFLRELTDVTVDELREEGVPADRAAAVGLCVAQRVCAEFRGQLIYVPIGFALAISERDQAMFDEYSRNGRDAAALAKKFGVSVQTAYKRVRLVEAAQYATRQGSLFTPEAG